MSRGGLIVLVLALVAPWQGAEAQAFGAPVALAQGLSGVFSSSAVDSAGDAVVAWEGVTTAGAYGAWASYRAAGGQWGKPVSIATLSYTFPPFVHFAPDGSATAVASDGTGVWAIDMKAGAGWGAPYQAAVGHGPIAFMEDEAGDAAIIYGANDTEKLLAARRAAGATTWTGPETVAAPRGGYVQLDGAQIGRAGDAVVSWEQYFLDCDPVCSPGNYSVFASRERTPGGGWVVSDALIGPLAAPGVSAPVVDNAHLAAVVFGAPGTKTPIDAVTQGRGAAWSQPVAIFSRVAPHYPAVMGAEVAGAGRATLGLMEQNGAGRVSVVNGALTSNTWRGAIDVSKADAGLLDNLPYGTQSFASNDKGGVALAWADAGGAIRVATRPGSDGKFGALQTANPANCTGGSNCTSVGALAVNVAGQEVVCWTTVEADGSVSLYVATTD